MADGWEIGIKRSGENSPGEYYSLPFSDNEELEGFNNSPGSDESDANDFSDDESPGKCLTMIGGLPVEMILVNSNYETQQKDAACRKSSRARKEKRSYSPVMQKKKSYKKRKQDVRAIVVKPQPFDKLPDGQPFNCDLCRSPYICNSRRRSLGLKKSKTRAVPRQQLDPETGKLLTLCNACDQTFGLPIQEPKKPPLIDEKEKEKYLEEAKQFAQSMVQLLSDPLAERLACPTFKIKGCACLQHHIQGNGEASGILQRATPLLVLLKDAKRLSALRCSDTPDGKRSARPGLGHGHKRAPQFEEFVLTNRRHLREDLKLCERATQRVLMYSNNFLHKRLKTEKHRQFRVERTKGKAVMGLLTPISQLIQESCCLDNCVSMALSHKMLLAQWRERAGDSQMEMRRVIAEMLTPSGGARPNCNKFISSVTGCSASTICKVRQQMRRTGGKREPPSHGMTKHWSKVKSKTQKKGSSTEGSSIPSDNRKITKATHPEQMSSINATRQQILSLEKELAKQQSHLKSLLNQVNKSVNDTPAEPESVTFIDSSSLANQTASSSSSPASRQIAMATDSGLMTVSLASPQEYIQSDYPTLQVIWSQDTQPVPAQSSVIVLPSSNITMATAPTATSTGLPTSILSGQTLLNLLKPEYSVGLSTETTTRDTQVLPPSGVQNVAGNKTLKTSNSLLGSLSAANYKCQSISESSLVAASSSGLETGPRSLPVYSHDNQEENSSQVEAVVQQILNFTGSVGLMGSPSKASTFIQQLAEYGTTIAPNINISLIQNESTESQPPKDLPLQLPVMTSVTSDDHEVTTSDPQDDLDPMLMPPLKYVLTIEQEDGDTAIPISVETVDSLEPQLMDHSDKDDLMSGGHKNDSQQVIDLLHILNSDGTIIKPS